MPCRPLAGATSLSIAGGADECLCPYHTGSTGGDEMAELFRAIPLRGAWLIQCLLQTHGTAQDLWSQEPPQRWPNALAELANAQW